MDKKDFCPVSASWLRLRPYTRRIVHVTTGRPAIGSPSSHGHAPRKVGVVIGEVGAYVGFEPDRPTEGWGRGYKTWAAALVMSSRMDRWRPGVIGGTRAPTPAACT